MTRSLAAFTFAAIAVWALCEPLEARAEKEKELLKTKAFRAIITPDGKYVAAAGDNVRLIDPVAKKSTVFRKTPAQPWMSNDGKALALVQSFATDTTDAIEIIDLTAKKGMGQFSIPSQGHVASAVSPEGTLFAYGTFKDLALVDVKTGKKTAEAKSLGGQPWCLEFTNDGKQLACGFDEKKVMLFEVEGLKAGPTFKMPDLVQRVVFTPDGKILAAAAGDSISIIEISSGKVSKKLAGTKGKIMRTAAFGADGKVLAGGSSDGIVTLWDTGSWKVLDTIKMPADVFYLSISADAKFLTVSLESNISYLYDVSAATSAK